MLDDGKTEAGAAGSSLARRICAIEAIEHMGDLLVSEGAAGVDDFDANGFSILSGGDGDVPFRWRVASGVGEQIREYLPEANGIALYNEPLRQIEMNSLIAGEAAEVQRGLDDRIEFGIDDGEAKFASLGTGDVFGGIRGEAIGDGFNAAAERSERSS